MKPDNGQLDLERLTADDAPELHHALGALKKQLPKPEQLAALAASLSGVGVPVRAPTAAVGNQLSSATRLKLAIVERLKSANPDKRFDFKVSVQQNSDVNAFAAPGGAIVVYTGLLDEAGSAEEVAGVLAHEMAHATRRHTMRQVIYSAGLLPLMGTMIGQADAATLFKNASQLSELKFSRAQEEDADQVGFDTLVAAGISPDGMAHFFDRLAKREGAAPSFVSTHPSSTDRAAVIRSKTKALGSKGAFEPMAIDWAAVKASLLARRWQQASALTRE